MEGEIWTPGQRWVSDSEPELGLGLITEVSSGRVEISFPAADEQRCYATETAPLRRVRFLPGDLVKDLEGHELTIHGFVEKERLLIYHTDEGDLHEDRLSGSISFSKPEQRLFGGKLDDPAHFDLRGEALKRRAEMRSSPVRGLVGARIDLIPHQLFIADEVAARLRPRVLLADEVGLGKTIEACLILHRLILTGRIQRALILVPGPLVYQWFVELLRRFNLSFSIFDEDRCEAIEYGNPDANPFLDSQLVLSAIDFLADDADRAGQAISAGWDMVVVDEAHHLEWTPESPGAAYQIVASLAEKTEGLLLLTATPQQLGPEGHFARLQLLDPERYADMERYRGEIKRYEAVADAVEALASGGTGDVESLVTGNRRLMSGFNHLVLGEEGARERLISDLIDGFGIGRVMFRNTRARLGGFPQRQPYFVAVTEKVEWLLEMLETVAPEKVLVIASTPTLAEEILEALRQKTSMATAVFHEGLTLLQRDRNAAFFADGDGARVLVCSEIGSEGRNFQFARHLVLFDLPADVDLLEQRIGRLDRIGQKGTIQIHVPYIEGSKDEVLMRWLDEGLDAFRGSPPGAAEIQRELRHELKSAFEDPGRLTDLLLQTQEVRHRIAERLARGQERLLERASHQPDRSEWLVRRIDEWDTSRDFQDFVLRLFEQSGMHIEELDRRRYFLRPESLKSDGFPSLPAEGMTVTLDRQRALEREHEGFLTWDHPMVRGALDLMLGSESGNASFAVSDSRDGAKRIFLEAWIIIECVAPTWLHIERFLPQIPLRVVVDHTGKEQLDDFIVSELRPGDPSSLLRNDGFKRRVLPDMLDKVRKLGRDRSRSIIHSAASNMHEQMSREVLRLRDLVEINDHVSSGEIVAMEEREQQLSSAIQAAVVRLDAVRLIWQRPAIN